MNFFDRLLTSFFFSPHQGFDFKPHGDRIKKRMKNSQGQWNTHLENTKNIISDFLNNESSSKKSVSILGAGSLLDVPDDIFNTQNKIYLQDANPDCLKDWSKVLTEKNNIIPCLLDISGVLKEWSEIVLNSKNSKTLEDILQTIENLEIHNHQKCPFIKSNINISLNLLSQIPVYWQDFVFYYLKKQFGNSYIKSKENLILNSLKKSSQKLVKSHLNHLVPENVNQRTLILTDINYYYLPKSVNPSLRKVKTENENRLSDYKLDFINAPKGEIQVELQDALFDFPMKDWTDTMNKSFQIKIIDSWLWNIGNESYSKKAVHQVLALSIEYKR